MKKDWNWFQNEKGNAAQSLPTALRGMPSMPTAYMGPFKDFYQDMDRMFNQAFSNVGIPALFTGKNAMPGMMFIPSVDISSTDKQYTIEVEVPGLNENDVRIDLLRDGQLYICGEKRQENENQDKDFHRVERTYGSFSRTLALPEDVDQENIEASFNNGLLTITAPRFEAPAAQAGRRIEVNAADTSRSRGKQQVRQQDNRSENATGGSAANTPKRAA